MVIIDSKGLDMQKWVMNKPGDKRRFQQFLDKQDQKKLAFIPWRARDKDEIVVLDAETGKYVGILDIAPPEIGEKAPLIQSAKK